MLGDRCETPGRPDRCLALPFERPAAGLILSPAHFMTMSIVLPFVTRR